MIIVIIRRVLLLSGGGEIEGSLRDELVVGREMHGAVEVGEGAQLSGRLLDGGNEGLDVLDDVRVLRNLAVVHDVGDQALDAVGPVALWGQL